MLNVKVRNLQNMNRTPNRLELKDEMVQSDEKSWEPEVGRQIRRQFLDDADNWYFGDDYDDWCFDDDDWYFDKDDLRFDDADLCFDDADWYFDDDDLCFDHDDLCFERDDVCFNQKNLCFSFDDDDLCFDDDDSTANPLKNPVVLARLFEMCELSDLYRLRLVSKQWYLLTLSRCRKEMKVKIDQSQNVSCLRECSNRRDLNHWTKQRAKLQFGGKPFNSFVIRDLEIRSEVEQFHESSEEEELKIYKHFWDKHGQWICKLELMCPIIYSADSFKKLIFLYTPNLQELELNGIRVNFEADPNDEEESVIVQPNLKCLRMRNLKKMPCTWRLFLLHFPNIQSLELMIGFHQDVTHHIAPLVDTLEELHLNRCKPMLIKKLILDRIYGDGGFGIGVKRLLQLPQLKLTSLHIDILGCEDNTMSILPVALRLHGGMLKDLRVIDCVNSTVYGPLDIGHYSNFPFQSEPFLSLTELHLEYAVSQNLHFLKHFPNLKTFRMIQKLGERMLRKTNWEILANFKLIHLEEFKFNVQTNGDDDYYIPKDVMERFVKLMPNVKSLSAQVEKRGLRVICQNWRELRKLKLHGNYYHINDEGMTGIEWGNEKRFPNVADLRYLRQLTVVGRGSFGELSVNKVFLRLPLLHTLNVSISCEVRKTTYQALVERFPNVKDSSLSIF